MCVVFEEAKGYLNVLVEVVGVFGVGLLWGKCKQERGKRKPVLIHPFPSRSDVFPPRNRHVTGSRLGSVPQTSEIQDQISDQGLEA